MKKLATSILILFLTHIAGLGIIEIAVRKFAPQNTLVLKGLFVNDLMTGFRCAPNFTREVSTPDYTYTIHTNSQGFRDKNHSSVNSQGIYRIMFLGDSFTFGYGVNEGDIYLRKFEGMFNRDSGKKCEAINMGLPEASTDNQYMLLTKYGLEYRPDLVVVAFFMDDVQGCLMGLDRIQVTDGLSYISPEAKQKWLYPIRNGRLLKDAGTVSRGDDILGWSLSSQIRRFLGQHFHAVHFLRNNYDFIHSKLTLKPYDSPYHKMTLFNLPSYFLKNYPPEVGTGWKITEDYLLKIRNMAHQKGARMVIMAIPANFQVYNYHWQTEKERYRLLNSSVDMDKPQRILAEFAQNNNIPLLDLLPKFKQHAASKDLYFHTDTHWTKEGHELAAEGLYKFVTSEYYQ